MPGPAIVPHPGPVRVEAGGAVLGASVAALLHRVTYAPDLYLPEADITAAGRTLSQASALPDLAGYRTFAFDTVEIYASGTRVQGHMRDPLKSITVEDVPTRLQIFVGEAKLVDTTAALMLHETGLPPRFYVPPGDVNTDFLTPSPRHSVCTYKGEATYHHIDTPDGQVENAVWTYAAPWTDFAADISRIGGYRGLYTSAMGRVLLDGVLQDASADAKTDAAMIAAPTIDAVLAGKA